MLLRMLLLFFLLLGSSRGTESDVVEVTGGRITGTVEQSASGRPYRAYRGVPYAGSPGGGMRFKPPSPVQPWPDVLTCHETGPICAQGGFGVQRGVEDCLHLSVYSPQVDQKASAPLPVLVWLHGGAFVVSGAGDYDPTLLMGRDMVLVVPQYRLGLYGFYYNDEAAPGNYGMLDQVAALRWVQDNIAQFGGDPNRVTLGGDDAGGASALYHMMAPKSQGLFHGVISVSGSPLTPWSKYQNNYRTWLILANYLKCPSFGPAMVHCFKDLEPETLLEAQMYLLEARDLMVGNCALSPVVQTFSGRSWDASETSGFPIEAPGEDAYFLQEEPIVLLGEGRFAQVPVLLIASKDIGNYLIDMSLYYWMVDLEEEKGEQFKDDMVGVLVTHMGVETGGEEEQQLWDQYLPDLRGASFEDKLPGLAQMLGDAMYNSGMIQTARYLNDKVPTWLMRFDFNDGPHSFHQRHPDPAEAPPIAPGAGHGDELNYFLPRLHEPFATDEQKRVSDTMLDMLDSFVSGRPPAAEWATTTDEGLECAVMSQKGTLEKDSFLPEGRLRAAEMMFQQQQKPILSMLSEKRQKDEL